MNASLSREPVAIVTAKIKDSWLDRTQRCIEDAQPHLTFNKDLSLHLQSTGRRRSLRLSFSSHIIIFRLHLSIIVYAGPHIGSLRAWGDTKGNILSRKIADGETWNFSLLICGSIAGVRIDCFSRKKIDGFVTQYAQTVGSVCCTLSVENDSDSICFIRKTPLRSPNSSFDKSDSLSIPNLFFYVRWCDISQRALSKAETTATTCCVKGKVRKLHICICIRLHFSFLIILFCCCCWRVKVWQTVFVLFQQLWQNSRVPPSEKLCGN